MNCQNCDKLEKQLLSAQAAIAEARKIHQFASVKANAADEMSKALESVDLSTLDKHDAEVRKVMVEAIGWALKVLELGETPQAEQILSDALSQVKEQP